jgi:serine/tyrosine/threonine adenylyltransferase
MRFGFEHSYAGLPHRFYAAVKPTPVEQPGALAVNASVASLLRLDPAALATREATECFAGNRVPEDARPIALAYAGHQFAHFVPQLGDGRAILLGEIVGTDGRRYDVQLKGAGRTPFSRGGDGRAALGPVLREYVVSEAMAALSVPTTRGLAAVTTGEHVQRDDVLPGAVLVRVAASHLRVGTFEYFAARKDEEALRLLVDYALERHYPNAKTPDGPVLALFDAVMAAQLALVARWLGIGFVHGVMNTDNFSISGETLDYGPCAFLDAYDPDRKFSSIDRHGRYAFMRQPQIAMWNLARFAETLLPLVQPNHEHAAAILSERLQSFIARFDDAYTDELRAKLGLSKKEPGDLALGRRLLSLMATEHADYTYVFRALSMGRTKGLLTAPAFEAWLCDWHARQARESTTPQERAEQMQAKNPAIIPRNHAIEHMIERAMGGDLAPFRRLLAVLCKPFDDHQNATDLTTPPGDEQWSYRTFCGT